MPLLSNWLTRARLTRVSQYLGRSVLDAGCGHAELLDYLPPHVEKIILLDRSPERREWVNRKQAATRIPVEFILFDIDRAEWDRNLEKVDTVIIAAVLEHLRKPLATVRHLGQTLKPGGTMVLTTPTPLGGKLHWLGSLIRLTYREAADEHERFYDFRALRSLLADCGLEMIRYEKFLFGLNQLVVARLASKEDPELVQNVSS